MTYFKVAAVAAALALATSPVAASDMLARSLGVDPDAYSLSELVALKGAIESEDRAAIRTLTQLRRPADTGPLTLVGYSDRRAAKPPSH